MKKEPSFIYPFIMLKGVIYGLVLKSAGTIDFWSSFGFNFDITVAMVCLVWLMYEMWATSQGATEPSDHVTRVFYGFSQCVTMFCALLIKPIWHEPSFFHIAGFILIISGISFRIWTIQTGIKYYNNIEEKGNKHFICTGPYKYLRHPSYTGMIITLFGIVFFYFNFVSVIVVFFAVLLPSIELKMAAEERVFFVIKGYAKSARYRSNVIPFNMVGVCFACIDSRVKCLILLIRCRFQSTIF